MILFTSCEGPSLDRIWQFPTDSQQTIKISHKTDKDTTEGTTHASYLDLLLSIGRDGQLHTSIYDKRDDFNFHIINFPFLSNNIPSSPAYGVFICQLIRYARAWFFYYEGQTLFQ